MKTHRNSAVAALDGRIEDSLTLDSSTLVKNVSEAIRLKGAKWQAKENPITCLPPETRSRLLSPTRFSPVRPTIPWHIHFRLPSAFDWRNVDGINYVTTPAKLQTDGTCASHASTDALESCVLRMGLSNDIHLDLAENAIIDTIGGGGNLHGIAAFMQTTGLPPISWYPGGSSTAVPGWEFHTYRQTSWDCLYPETADQVKSYLVGYGPVVTTMNCPPDFFSYADGVYTNVYSQPGGFHAILVVGYDDAESCFKIKNNWGTGWGQQGFGKIAYSEFRSSLVNFGWDIHTYITADKNFSDQNDTPNNVLVPPVVGMRPNTARTMLESVGLRCRLTGVTSSPNSSVFSQSPLAGRSVSEGVLVTCRCSTNPPQ